MIYHHTRSESLAPVEVQRHLLANGKWGILESDRSHSMDGVMTRRTLVDLEKRTVPVRILNLTNGVKRIKKGTSIAMCESVQSVVA